MRDINYIPLSLLLKLVPKDTFIYFYDEDDREYRPWGEAQVVAKILKENDGDGMVSGLTPKGESIYIRLRRG